MKTLILLFATLSMQAFAYQIETSWTDDSKKILRVTCDGDSICENFCGSQACEIEEKVCKNCVGTSIGMTYAFQEMGRSYIVTEVLDPYFLFDLLKSKKFVSLTSRSLYNLVDRFDSIELRRKFRGLCVDGTRYPHVFFKTQRSGELGEIQAVWCEDGVYQMGQTSINDSSESLY